jgi:hypothetical protein
MDADRFDALSRLLGSPTTRRGTLFALLSGALSLTGSVTPEAGWAASGRCRFPCGPCQSCKKGKCVRTSRGKRCKRGRCVPRSNGILCGNPVSGFCQDGSCVPFPPPPPPPPCRTLQEDCNNDCCEGLVCGESRCSFSDRLCVLPEGEVCDGDSCSCAQGQKCSPVTNRCRACISDPSEECQEADDCCLPGVFCESRDGGPRTCCIGQNNEAVFCIETSQCCAGLICSEQTGRCVRVG